MDLVLVDLIQLAAETAPAPPGAPPPPAEEESGNFLVTPDIGIMLWTLIAFGITLFFLKREAFPRIAANLDKRRKAIEDSIDHAERTRHEADQLLSEYRERLKEAREQAEDIVARARKASDRLADDAKAEAKQTREEMMEDTRREIEFEKRRAIEDLRREVANLTVLATEKVARKSLDDQDHKRLIEDALQEFDWSALSGENGDATAGQIGSVPAQDPTEGG